MRSLNGVVLAAIAVFAIILVSMATFIVNPTEQALILRFGRNQCATSSTRRASISRAVCRYGCLYRQTHSRALQRAPGGAGV